MSSERENDSPKYSPELNSPLYGKTIKSENRPREAPSLGIIAKPHPSPIFGHTVRKLFTQPANMSDTHDRDEDEVSFMDAFLVQELEEPEEEESSQEEDVLQEESLAEFEKIEPHNDLPPPPPRLYRSKDALIRGIQAHSRRHGFNAVIKTSSIPSAVKPHRTRKIWFRCDRGGEYRVRNGLNETTRKRKRTSRLTNCPFLLIAACEAGVWAFLIDNPQHNHGPFVASEHGGLPRIQKGQVDAVPYPWPADACFNPYTTALVVIDMQRDFCAPGGFLDHHGYDITDNQALIPRIKLVLDAFRKAGFPVFHTREGHRADLSTLLPREKHRTMNNDLGLGIGDEGPLGRLLVRGEAGSDIVPELQPVDGEPVIDKPGRSAFAYTEFDLLLKVKGIKNIVICGISTNISITATARDATDRTYECLVLEDGTAAAKPEIHKPAIESIKWEGGVFGVCAMVDDVVAAANKFYAANRAAIIKSGFARRHAEPLQKAKGNVVAKTAKSNAETKVATSEPTKQPATSEKENVVENDSA